MASTVLTTSAPITPFFSTKAEGTGLGLSIARTLAEHHGGHLVLRNAPDGGASATLSLPCAREPS
jgi:signal transduction histidine kinase